MATLRPAVVVEPNVKQTRIDEAELNFLKMIDFGMPGAGKTHLFRSALERPEVFLPALYLDHEGGSIPLRGAYQTALLQDVLSGDHAPSHELLTRVRIRTFEELDAIQESLTSFDLAGVLPYQSVFIDSLSEIAYVTLNAVVEESVASRPHRDDEVPEMGDYQRQGIRIRKLIRNYRDLNAHVVFSCLAQEATTPRGTLQWRPALSGKLALETPGLISALGMLVIVQDEQGNKHRELLFEPEDRFFVKSRYASLLPSVVDPTLGKLYDLIMQS